MESKAIKHYELITTALTSNPEYIEELAEIINDPNGKGSYGISKVRLEKEVLISILNSLPYGIQIVDINGIIKFVNEKFLSILRVSKEERIGKSIFQVSIDGSISAVLKTGKAVSNLKNYPRDTTVALISSAAPIILSDKLIGAVAVVNDVNDVKILYNQLIERKKIINNLSEKINSLAKTTYNLDDIIGNCKEIRDIKEMIKLAAFNDTTVLITGETGTGKQLVAESIHSASPKLDSPFVSINCSAIPENLLESELFGFEKGSFTGAFKTQIGKFELANGGTLFLDEIGDMDLKLQSKILKAIEEKQIQRLGGDTLIPLSIRIIAATNRDLKGMVNQGLFRQDLYYRLNVFNITIPPLRSRKDDIKELCDFLIRKISRRIGRRGITINEESIELIKMYSWPGNVRELKNILERVIISSNNWKEINIFDLDIIQGKNNKYPFHNKVSTRNENERLDYDIDSMNLREIEKIVIGESLRKFGTTYSGKHKAADALGISIATLYNKIKEYKTSKGV